jgi:hypothetical protein
VQHRLLETHIRLATLKRLLFGKPTEKIAAESTQQAGAIGDAGEDPLEWLLLTNLPVQTPEQASEKPLWSLGSWQVEVYFKVLKSGCCIIAMREIIKSQLQLGEQDIGAIVIDARSCDDIPRLLRGLQHIDSTPALREQVFAILAEVLPQRGDGASSRRVSRLTEASKQRLRPAGMLPPRGLGGERRAVSGGNDGVVAEAVERRVPAAARLLCRGRCALLDQPARSGDADATVFDLILKDRGEWSSLRLRWRFRRADPVPTLPR